MDVVIKEEVSGYTGKEVMVAKSELDYLSDISEKLDSIVELLEELPDELKKVIR